MGMLRRLLLEVLEDNPELFVEYPDFLLVFRFIRSDSGVVRTLSPSVLFVDFLALLSCVSLANFSIFDFCPRNCLLFWSLSLLAAAFIRLILALSLSVIWSSSDSISVFSNIVFASSLGKVSIIKPDFFFSGFFSFATGCSSASFLSAPFLSRCRRLCSLSLSAAALILLTLALSFAVKPDSSLVSVVSFFAPGIVATLAFVNARIKKLDFFFDGLELVFSKVDSPSPPELSGKLFFPWTSSGGGGGISSAGGAGGASA
mmetsp:Transcript_14995/g.16975  ORF Transcript_14995/g.16975 Transcript_14995/m.16975 type:complete len:259 (-) Transcript_14995:12-788(-)